MLELGDQLHLPFQLAQDLLHGGITIPAFEAWYAEVIDLSQFQSCSIILSLEVSTFPFFWSTQGRLILVMK